MTQIELHTTYSWMCKNVRLVGNFKMVAHSASVFTSASNSVNIQQLKNKPPPLVDVSYTNLDYF
jgi:hypothetical protein